jgi:hypothetical protein
MISNEIQWYTSTIDPEITKFAVAQNIVICHPSTDVSILHLVLLYVACPKSNENDLKKKVWTYMQLQFIPFKIGSLWSNTAIPALLPLFIAVEEVFTWDVVQSPGPSVLRKKIILITYERDLACLSIFRYILTTNFDTRTRHLFYNFKLSFLIFRWIYLFICLGMNYALHITRKREMCMCYIIGSWIFMTGLICGKKWLCVIIYILPMHCWAEMKF